MDEAGVDLPERVVGRLVFRGPSMTSGYYCRPEATAAITLPGGWLDSGDLAYRAAITALCDKFDDRFEVAKQTIKVENPKTYTDFEKVLAAPDIDAVIIATPPFEHPRMLEAAVQARKHVYCEKPLAHSYAEVSALMAAAKKYKVVTQLGNQGHSSGSIRQLCEWVWAGAIGRVHTVHAACDAFKEVYCQLRNLDKINQHYDVPKSLDYDLWIGPVPFRPYTPFWVHWNWRGWMPFGTGTIAVPRQAHLMMLALRPPEDCRKGTIKVHVTQQSSGRTAMVEFRLANASSWLISSWMAVPMRLQDRSASNTLSTIGRPDTGSSGFSPGTSFILVPLPPAVMRASIRAMPPPPMRTEGPPLCQVR